MRFLQVTVEVMTRDPATAELIKKNDPMIRNDLLMLFGNQTYETISTREGKEQLRAEALKVVAQGHRRRRRRRREGRAAVFHRFVMQ